MGTDQIPQTPPRSRQAAATPPTVRTSSRPADDLAPEELPREVPDGPRAYLKMAFANPYNLSLFLGGVATSALTGSAAFLIVAAGLEALWLLHAPDSPILRRRLWDPQLQRLRDTAAAADREARIAPLDHASRTRVEALLARQAEIHRLAAQNPSFARDLLRSELAKTDRLVSAYVEMSLTCQRYSGYLSNIDPGQLDRDRKRYGDIAKAAGANDPEAQIAQKNVVVTDKRMAKLEEIRRYLQVARGQLDLIENSFQLLVEQIVTMQSPRELSGQLDELLDGVEAIRETTRDTEMIIGRLDRDE